MTQLTTTGNRVRRSSVPQFPIGSDESRSVRAALSASNLLWTPEFRPLFIENEESLGGIEAVPGHRALVRPDNGKLLGVHGGAYTAVGQLECFEPTIQPLLDSGEVRITSCDSILDGAKVWIEAEFTSGGEAEVGLGDVVRQKLRWSNSHDGTTNATLAYVLERLACLNGMTKAETSALFRARHTKGIRVELDKWRTEFAKQRADMGETIGQFRAMARRSLNDRALTAYVREVLSPGATEETTVRGVDRIVELAHTAPGATPGTLWGGLNAVTYWATHERGRSDDSRINANLFGRGGELIERAQQVAVTLIESLPHAELARESYANHASASSEFGRLLGGAYTPSDTPSLF